jgi:hypothetical protein
MSIRTHYRAAVHSPSGTIGSSIQLILEPIAADWKAVDANRGNEKMAQNA